MTTLADTTPITAQARQVRFWPTMLALAAFLLIGLGRVTYRLFAFAWLAGAWTFVAVRQGWREAKAADRARRLAASRRAAD